MNNSNVFKSIWWVLITLGIFSLLFTRREAFLNGDLSAVDGVLMLVGIGLLLGPLFQEVDIFGVRLVKEVESLRTDVKEQILSLRADIQNRNEVSNQFNPQLTFPQPLADEQVEKMQQAVQKMLDDRLRELGIQHQVQEFSEINVPKMVNDLFAARYQVERELRRIWKDRYGATPDTRILPLLRIADALTDDGILDRRLRSIIRDLYGIASPAIHGNEVSEKQAEFVIEISPELLTALRAIN